MIIVETADKETVESWRREPDVIFMISEDEDVDILHPVYAELSDPETGDREPIILAHVEDFIPLKIEGYRYHGIVVFEDQGDSPLEFLPPENLICPVCYSTAWLGPDGDWEGIWFYSCDSDHFQQLNTNGLFNAGAWYSVLEGAE